MSKGNTELFSPLNEYFDHIYVLTLEHTKDRQENVAKVLDGLNWSFFWGTDKKKLDMETVKRDGVYDEAKHRETKRTHRAMSLGEVACSLSHRRIHEDMLEKGYQRVLIMEDDVLPQPENLRRFNEVVAQLPDNWELLMLGYYGHKPPTLRYRLQQKTYLALHHLNLFNWGNVSKKYIEELVFKPYSADLYEIGKVLGAHAYAISASAARKFVDYQTPVILQADRIYNYYKAEYGLNGFAVKDTMFTLSELSNDSYIQDDI